MKTFIVFVVGVALGAVYAPFIKPTLVRWYKTAKENLSRGP